MANRLHALDYVRGLAATAIMGYHYTSWSYAAPGADEFLGRVGLYGVAIFYILSGLTLYHVYAARLKLNSGGLLSFAKKRILRIFPLLWLVTLITIGLKSIDYNGYDLLLNLSGAFGFLKWDAYYATGVWSIGNELVFYAMFPFFIWAARKSWIVLAFLTLITFGCFTYFATSVLTPSANLSTQWRDYINPLNQAFLFAAGIVLGYIFKHRDLNKAVTGGLIGFGLLAFIFLPSGQEQIGIVSGAPRVAFTSICAAICLGAYKVSGQIKGLLGWALTMLGEASYSIYLLHPLVYFVVKRTLAHLPIGTLSSSPPLLIIVSVIGSFLLSFLVYTHFEQFFMRLGRPKN